MDYPPDNTSIWKAAYYKKKVLTIDRMGGWSGGRRKTRLYLYNKLILQICIGYDIIYFYCFSIINKKEKHKDNLEMLIL